MPSRPVLPEGAFGETRPLLVPPGVDSTAAQKADSLAQKAFVPFEQQDQARAEADRGHHYVALSDTLWEYLEMSRDTTGSVSEEQAYAAIRAFNEGARVFRAYAQAAQQTDLDSLQLMQMQAQLLDEAQQHFERAIRLNPYDLQAQDVLASVYVLQARRLNRAGQYTEAISILEKLTRLRPEQYGLFASLANAYYESGQWYKAAENYAKSAETYRLAAEFGDVALDSTQLYQLKRAEGSAYVEARMAAPALEAYREALALAQAEDERAFVQGEIEYINWDDGNLAANFARDSLLALVDRGALEEAARGFEELKPRLKTQKARDWTDWRLALIEYNLGRKDTAAERLQALYQRTPRATDGSPVDTTYVPYFDAYGTIVYNLGLEYLAERRSLQGALSYFEQGTRFPWSGRPRAAMEAAKILQNDLQSALNYAHMALEEKELLNLEDQQELYRMLVNLSRRQGDLEQARSYMQAYRALAQGNQ
ncbi:hypothetical protein GQ464_002830 [Rhodocaloribacter litoris]|uniref:hypothetical protein n=1 Tax=Rhodocaloribacter litoris TaxID=2558931 RepID=UPI001E584ECE|nr:hypothetical protein [Rhodocaloribacter litoris]QXD15900.1 hypothetical protein GQ464_002830 [Rhodocaloribacter litoris]